MFPKQHFSFSYDTFSKIVTAATLVLMSVVMIREHNLFIGGVVVLIVVGAYAWAPTGYEISGRSVVVKRLIGSVDIPIESIRDVRAATRDDLRWSLRVFGSGGLFGHYGIFRTSEFGTCTWYVTNRSRPVVMITDDGTKVLSPDDTNGFVAAIRSVGASSDSLRLSSNEFNQ